MREMRTGADTRDETEMRCHRTLMWSWSGPGVMSSPDWLRQLLNTHTHTHTHTHTQADEEG